MRRVLFGAALAALLAGPALALPPVSEGDVDYQPSRVQAVFSTISAAGASSLFTPQAGRIFHVQLSGVASATCSLERQLDGSTWVPITVTANGSTTTMYNWTYTGSALSEDVVEAQSGVPYRVDCGAQLGSFTSGLLSVRLSQ